jgi:hypothetical protein
LPAPVLSVSSKSEGAQREATCTQQKVQFDKSGREFKTAITPIGNPDIPDLVALLRRRVQYRGQAARLLDSLCRESAEVLRFRDIAMDTSTSHRPNHEGKQHKTDVCSGHLFKEADCKGVVYSPSQIVEVAVLKIRKPKAVDPRNVRSHVRVANLRIRRPCYRPGRPSLVVESCSLL